MREMKDVQKLENSTIIIEVGYLLVIYIKYYKKYVEENHVTDVE